jgi:PhnB protein
MSKIQLSPYVNFQGRAREAMEFYHEALGGNLDLQTGPGDSIRHARLEADGVLIIGSDGHPDYPAKVGDSMGIALGGTDKDRLTRIFNDLAEGGTVQMPLAKQPWGAEVGWLRDRFGINWNVNIDTDHVATRR